MKSSDSILLEAALASRHCVVSVMGDHAGEHADAIFRRKKADIERLGVTYWLIRSPKARPPQVQRIGMGSPIYAIFIEPATKGGSRSTTEEDEASEYSHDRASWRRLPEGLSPVTGKVDAGGTALVLDKVTADVAGTLDLWYYAEAFDMNRPIRFALGCSTVCAVRKDMRSSRGRMKSRYREIVAVARLANPYCVWIR